MSEFTKLNPITKKYSNEVWKPSVKFKYSLPKLAVGAEYERNFGPGTIRAGIKIKPKFRGIKPSGWQGRIGATYSIKW